MKRFAIICLKLKGIMLKGNYVVQIRDDETVSSQTLSMSL
jgi:hypothetical protein